MVDDGSSPHDTCSRAHLAASDVKEHPADIVVVGHDSYFERKDKVENTLMVEGEAHKIGVLLHNRRG